MFLHQRQTQLLIVLQMILIQILRLKLIPLQIQQLMELLDVIFHNFLIMNEI